MPLINQNLHSNPKFDVKPKKARCDIVKCLFRYDFTFMRNATDLFKKILHLFITVHLLKDCKQNCTKTEGFPRGMI